MHTLALQLCLVVSLGLAAGCGSSEPRLSLTKYDQVQSEIERVSKELDASQAAKLKTAAEVLAMHAMMSATSEDAQSLSSVDALNGKTPSEVIAAYEKLGPELQLKIGQQIAKARAEAPLKEANDRLQTAMKLASQLEHDQKYDGNPSRSRAIANILLTHDKKLSDVGKLEAAIWLESEFLKGSDYVVSTYGSDAFQLP